MGPMGTILLWVRPLSPQPTSQANFYLKMACLDLRRDRLFQRVAQRPYPSKQLQKDNASTIVRCPLLARSPFVRYLRE